MADEAELVLLRHAEAGASSCYWGASDVALSPRGVRTATAVANKMALSGTPQVLSSPQRCAVQTATIVAARLGTAVTVDSRLAAKDYGSYTGHVQGGGSGSPFAVHHVVRWSRCSPRSGSTWSIGPRVGRVFLRAGRLRWR